MKYSLNTKIVNSTKTTESAVILCHGYGGDGNDISIVANYWKNFLPKTLFLCPDAPEICKVNPSGFQWFDLMDQTPEQVLAKSLVAENKLNKLIDEVKKNNSLKADQIIIGGFSQGCMITLQAGLKRKDMVNSVIGYSGRIIDTEHLSKNINSRPNIILMHGDIDQVVSIDSLLEAKDFFNKNNYEIETKIFKNCEHRIPTEGSSLGLQFIKKQFNS